MLKRGEACGLQWFTKDTWKLPLETGVGGGPVSIDVARSVRVLVQPVRAAASTASDPGCWRVNAGTDAGGVNAGELLQCGTLPIKFMQLVP